MCRLLRVLSTLSHKLLARCHFVYFKKLKQNRSFQNKDIQEGEKDLSFLGNDPGAARYGNFINYYSFHSADERLISLNPVMFPEEKLEKIICLDIGCNSGNLTSELYDYLKLIYPESVIEILAVDIDSILIHRAEEQYNNGHISFVTSDITTNKGYEIIQKYLQKQGKDKFDIIFCFSVTMWIHLNNGDVGLTKFLKFVKDYSRTLILEAQPWKCYKMAQRRIKRSGGNFELYDSLSIRSNVLTYVDKNITKSHKKVCTIGSSWNRKIQSYHIK